MLHFKDKLEKTGHNKAYFRLRNLFLGFLITLGVLALGAIPVGISFKLAEAQAAAESSSRLAAASQAEEEESDGSLPQ